MLNSPVADQANFSSLFPTSDFSSLIRKDRGVLDKCISANTLLNDFDNFLSAYSRLGEDDVVRSKVVSLFEVRVAMFIFTKKFESRTSYPSLLATAHAAWKEIKVHDDKLPEWIKLKPLGASGSSSSVAAPSTTIRDINRDGVLSDEIMIRKGFKPDAIISNGERHVIISELCSDLHNVKVKPCDKHGNVVEDAAIEELPRMVLIDKFMAHKIVKPEFVTTYPEPCLNHEIKVSALQGALKVAMMADFAQSDETRVVLQTSPQV